MSADPTRIDLVALLGSFPVKGAIFTTYTLSLTWFETYLLRQLERQGASRVAVIADADGVEMSLREGLARGVGIRYALEAVRLPRGVMHAKVAVVWGEEALLVAVGSGNLTLPGMQRNLEVWDVLVAGVPDASAESLLTRSVADGVSTFLESLRDKLDRKAWANGLVDEARGTLREWRDDLPESERPLWADSSIEPIGHQVVRALGRVPRRFEWLSPFHDAAGEAALRLGRETGATQNTLLFADDTTFPLAASRRRGTVFARQITVESGSHHAKVYRWREENQSHILAGSANATHAALWTTDNLEACLLRSGAPDEWDALLESEAAEPKESANPPIAATSFPIRIASARAGHDGVRVSLRCSSPPPQHVGLGYLEHDDHIEVPWAEDVMVPFPRAHDALRPKPLRVQAEVESGGRVWRARAWVSFDEFLDASPEYRRSVTQLARLLGSEGGEEEDRIEILNLFTEEHARTLGALGRWVPAPGGGQRPGAAKEDEDLPVPVRLLMLAGGGSGPVSGRSGLGSASTVDAVRHAMREAFRALEQPGATQVQDDDDDDLPAPESARRVEFLRRQSATAAVAVMEFESRFFQVVNATVKRPAKPEYALAYAAFCMRLALRLRARASDPTEGLLNSLDNWVKALLRPRNAAPPLATLLKVAVPPAELVGLAAAAIAVLSRRSASPVDPRRPSQRLRRHALREALDTLDRFAGVIGPRMPRELASALPLESADPEASLEELRQLPTGRARMLWVLGLARDLSARTLKFREVTEATPVAPHGALEADERELLATAHRGRPPRPTSPWASACPECHSPLPKETQNRLSGGSAQLCSGLRCRLWLLPLEAE